jgi:hypothetical protein
MLRDGAKGSVVAASGATLVNDPGASLQVRGSGGEASLGWIVNSGHIDVSRGARMSAELLLQGGEDASTRVGRDAELVLGSRTSQIVAGTLALEGRGRIEMIGAPLEILAGGQLLPGGVGEVGALAIEGDVDFVGELAIEIGGSLAGEFDFVSVEDTLELAGLVDASLVDLSGCGDLFDPEVGDHFDVIVAGAIIDLSPSFLFPVLDGDRRFVSSIVSAGPNQALRFSVVPEPGTAFLFALGLVILAARAGFREALPLAQRLRLRRRV